MTRWRIIVVLLFIIAFGAGLSVGKLSHQPASSPSQRGPSWLSQELGLTPEQRQSMLDIWDKVNHSGFDESSLRRDLQKQRSDAIAQLVPQDKQAQLKQINDDYSKRSAELSSQRHQRFMDAIEKTKAVLKPDQRKKYEEILAQRDKERRSNPRGSRSSHSPRDSRSNPGGQTQRSTQPPASSSQSSDPSSAGATTQPAAGQDGN